MFMWISINVTKYWIIYIWYFKRKNQLKKKKEWLLSYLNEEIFYEVDSNDEGL